MIRFKGATLLLFLTIALSAADAMALDSYLAVKAGGFLPNGKGGGDRASSSQGFSNFSQGFNGEVAAGIRPESYAAVELGVGYYQTDADIASTGGQTNKYSASSIPVTLTVKGILPYGRLEAFAGAGIGYWAARLHYEQLNASSTNKLERNLNAGALGYQVVAGADYRLTERLDVGAEAKWSSAKPEFDFVDTFGTKQKWEFGGTTLNMVLKFRF